jgi:hypothetical protein
LKQVLCLVCTSQVAPHTVSSHLAAQHAQQAKQEPQQAVTTHELSFPDLRFAKPSRMLPVYIAFCLSLPDCEGGRAQSLV